MTTEQVRAIAGHVADDYMARVTVSQQHGQTYAIFHVFGEFSGKWTAAWAGSVPVDLNSSTAAMEQVCTEACVKLWAEVSRSVIAKDTKRQLKPDLMRRLGTDDIAV